jgi:adenylyltransferase/sulfurtransferase
MQFDSIHSIKGEEDFLDKTLFEVGIPLMHIICGRVGMNTTYYEFTADKEEIFD